MIYFPVIRSIDIKGFQIYQNQYNDGITHVLNGGVHLIIGVNGLGKTTLLNALFRALVGPKDIPKSDTALLGSTKHALTAWRSSSFFKSRVKDNALKATIRCNISFGDNYINIERKLSNLEVINLSVNGEVLEASQDEYERQIIKISGVADYVDFYYITKYLIFFLEDRTELIWDDRAQFEMMRILFFDIESSQKAVMYYDMAQTADSKFRNIHASLSSIKERLKSYGDSEDEHLKAKFIAEKSKLSALEELFTDIQYDYLEQKNNIEEAKLSRAKLARELDELKYAIDYKQHALYGHYLPANDDALNYIFNHLNSGSGCLACGNATANSEYFHEKFIHRKKCPICNSSIDFKINDNNSTSNLNNELKILYKKMERSNQSILAQTEVIEILSKNLESVEIELSNVMFDLKNSQKQVRQLGKKIPLDDEEIQELKRIIDFREIELRSYDRERKEANENYLKILNQNTEELSKKMKALEEKFKYYSKNLLAESVFIHKETQPRRIGQGNSAIEFPCFKVSMTSGVFDRAPSKRDSSDSVSESQKEFIDLAFRLSLIDIATSINKSPAMVVMETPEASLDSLFMHEASRLFREFASSQDGRNVFLASTNLNKSEMIPALLGCIDLPKVYNKSDSDLILDNIGEEQPQNQVGVIRYNDRKKHIINLLEIAAPNLSLKNHREDYNKMFNSAVYPDDIKDIENE
ncbi:TPA: AAA family ATPase [Serratia fonticola]|nr:AAA family ATPase [Serratia fonticola]